MSPIRFLAPLLAALALLPALIPGAAASPCTSPCGEVKVIHSCTAWSATAEGAGGSFDAVWVFTVHVHANGNLVDASSQSSTGPAAAFQSSGTGTPAGSLAVFATLHADGALVDSDGFACG